MQINFVEKSDFWFFVRTQFGELILYKKYIKLSVLKTILYVWPVLQGIHRVCLVNAYILGRQYSRKNTILSIKIKHENDCLEWRLCPSIQHVNLTFIDVPHSSPHMVFWNTWIIPSGPQRFLIYYWKENGTRMGHKATEHIQPLD